MLWSHIVIHFLPFATSLLCCIVFSVGYLLACQSAFLHLLTSLTVTSYSAPLKFFVLLLDKLLLHMHLIVGLLTLYGLYIH